MQLIKHGGEVFQLLKVGDTIFLELKDFDDEVKQRFKCRLVDRNDDMLFVDYPINEKTKKPGFFYDGTQFKAFFVSKDRSIFLFETELQGRKRENIPMLILKDPGEETYIKIQRRQYVRVGTSVDIAIHSKNGEFKPFTTVSLDLSGGGMAIAVPAGIVLPQECEVNSWLVLHMQSGEINYIHTVCRIIRVFKEKEGDKERASLQFVSISEQERQTVIRYCFERQLLLKRKENEK